MLDFCDNSYILSNDIQIFKCFDTNDLDWSDDYGYQNYLH